MFSYIWIANWWNHRLLYAEIVSELYGFSLSILLSDLILIKEKQTNRIVILSQIIDIFTFMLSRHLFGSCLPRLAISAAISCVDLSIYLITNLLEMIADYDTNILLSIPFEKNDDTKTI